MFEGMPNDVFQVGLSNARPKPPLFTYENTEKGLVPQLLRQHSAEQQDKYSKAVQDATKEGPGAVQFVSDQDAPRFMELLDQWMSIDTTMRAGPEKRATLASIGAKLKGMMKKK